ncbi:MAG TPA: DUF6491 family protein [Rhizomicrobium sp.]|nr:DUF6491 family protein [Rhizomicrobium sp.]
MTRSLLIAALLCIAAPAIAQPAAQPAPSDPPCLRQRNIYDFKTVPGNRSLIVTDLANKRYRLNFMGVCHNLQHHLQLGFKTEGVGTLSCITRGDSVLQRDVIGPNRCVIQSVEYQTPALDKADAEAAAAAKAKKQ